MSYWVQRSLYDNVVVEAVIESLPPADPTSQKKLPSNKIYDKASHQHSESWTSSSAPKEVKRSSSGGRASEKSEKKRKTEDAAFARIERQRRNQDYHNRWLAADQTRTE